MLSLGAYMGFALSGCMRDIRNVALFAFSTFEIVEKINLKEQL
jgi:hypothetical protein